MSKEDLREKEEKADKSAETESEKASEKEKPNEAQKTSAEREEQKKAKAEKPKKEDKKSEAHKKEIEKLNAENAELNDRYLRMMAEYDNFRRRAQKERENAYSDAYGDALKEILPIMDNLERAAAYKDNDKVSEGVTMTLNQFKATLEKMGVTEIDAKPGGKFDPNFHNAVMHAEDENYGENEIVEVFQKGYAKGDRVIRYTMVKVAN